jgi:RAB protein geranylgeranyltransferase component A
MSYYLVVYDRSTGAVEVEEFTDQQRDLALHRRFEHERKQRNRSEVEIVVLGAESREALEGTHARYFKTVQELAKTGM